MLFLQDFSLQPYNTFGIAASARYFTSFSSEEGLKEVLRSEHFKSLPHLVLGGGSNVLLTGDYDGLVLRNEIKGITVEKQDENHIYVKTGAGENWHEFVLFCVRNGYAGVENLSLIPGNTGASPMQNIGAYGVEIKDVFHELEAVNNKDGEVRRFSAEDCSFGYRESVFKNKYKGQFIITSVTFRLNTKPVFHTSYGAIRQELDAMGVKDLSIQAISQAVINIRSSKLPDPKEIGNAGSFFKNPMVDVKNFEDLKQQYPNLPSFPGEQGTVKVPAGWLIEQCGWKGYRKGDAGCYPKQALVLVNYGAASGQEIYQLSEEIIESVKSKFGIALEREVNIV
jgi:UDP-N-acetylmuramate dehydrogenase